jgi:hypothetical protein
MHRSILRRGRLISPHRAKRDDPLEVILNERSEALIVLTRLFLVQQDEIF